MILSLTTRARGALRLAAPPLAALVALAAFACSSPPEVRSAEEVKLTESAGRHEPKDDTEREILSLLDELAVDQPRVVRGHTVRAGAAYASASGRPCREVRLEEAAGASKDATTRLACRDADSWFFVPDVFGAGAGAP